MPTRGLPARPRPRTAQPRLLKAASKSSPQLLKSASLEADGLKWRMINEKAAESLLITASLGGETAALVEAREWERSEALHATVDALGERLAATRAVAERKAEELFLLSEKQGAGEQVDAGLPKLVAHAAAMRGMLEKVEAAEAAVVGERPCLQHMTERVVREISIRRGELDELRRRAARVAPQAEEAGRALQAVQLSVGELRGERARFEATAARKREAMATELAAREAAVEKLALAEMVHDTRAKARAAIPERVRRESAVGDTERFDYHRLNQAEWALVGRASATQRPKATEEEYKSAWDRLVAATGTDSTDAMLMKHVDATASIELLAESRRAAEERVAKLRAEKDGLVQQSRDVEHLGYRKLQSKDVEAIEAKMARARAACEKHEGRHAAAATALLHARGGLRGLCRAAAAAGVKETSLHDPRGRTAIAAYRRWALSDPIAEAAAARAEAEVHEVAAPPPRAAVAAAAAAPPGRRRRAEAAEAAAAAAASAAASAAAAAAAAAEAAAAAAAEAQAAAPRRPATAGASGGGAEGTTTTATTTRRRPRRRRRLQRV